MEFIGGGGGMWHGDPMSPEDEARLREHFENYAEVHLSPLVRVIAIGQEAEAAGIRVELIALEIREAGSVLSWRAFATDDRILGLAVIEVTDDRGGEYHVFLGGGGGGERAWNGDTNIVPAAKPDAAILRVKVTGFDGFPPGFPGAGSNRHTEEGPWVFEVPLAD